MDVTLCNVSFNLPRNRFDVAYGSWDLFSKFLLAAQPKYCEIYLLRAMLLATKMLLDFMIARGVLHLAVSPANKYKNEYK